MFRSFRSGCGGASIENGIGFRGEVVIRGFGDFGKYVTTFGRGITLDIGRGEV